LLSARRNSARGLWTTHTIYSPKSWRPPRYYIPPEDVRTDLLVPSETKAVCPYKGVASYRSARSNGEVAEDLA